MEPMPADVWERKCACDSSLRIERLSLACAELSRPWAREASFWEALMNQGSFPWGLTRVMDKLLWDGCMI
jgi:hypothetical protein